MFPRILLLIITLFFTANCIANPAHKPHLDQLSWLTGCWNGTGLGGKVEECWVSSPDGKYTSVFQMMKAGQLQFTEIVMINEFDGTLGMRVKHFDAAFEQWESDNGVGPTFPFVKMGENFIQFEGLRYELIDDALHVTLDIKRGKDIHQEKFVYTRN